MIIKANSGIGSKMWIADISSDVVRSVTGLVFLSTSLPWMRSKSWNWSRSWCWSNNWGDNI